MFGVSVLIPPYFRNKKKLHEGNNAAVCLVLEKSSKKLKYLNVFIGDKNGQ